MSRTESRYKIRWVCGRVVRGEICAEETISLEYPWAWKRGEGWSMCSKCRGALIQSEDTCRKVGETEIDVKETLPVGKGRAPSQFGRNNVSQKPKPTDGEKSDSSNGTR